MDIHRLRRNEQGTKLLLALAALPMKIDGRRLRPSARNRKHPSPRQPQIRLIKFRHSGKSREGCRIKPSEVTGRIQLDQGQYVSVPLAQGAWE